LGPSRQNRLSQHTLSDTRLEATFCDHIHPALQELLQIVLETSQVKKGPARLKLNEEIYVASFVGFASNYRAENPHIMGAILGTNPQDLLAFSLQKFLEPHS
jgi:hypothetical protein